MDETVIWSIIDKYFKNNPNVLVEHHLESFNDFFRNDIFRIFREKNPLRLVSNYDETIDDYRNQCLMYFGGKDASKIYFGKPIIYDDDKNIHYMYPNEARLRNMTYGITIHYDIDVEYIDILRPGEEPSVINVENATVDINFESADDYVIKKQFENIKSLDQEEEPEVTEGGAGRPKPKKKDRSKREKKPYTMTTAMTAEMREATEDSLVNPLMQKRTDEIKNVYLGRIPIMLQSDFCILKGLPVSLRETMGECRNDIGGYFIINGKEKTVVSQEKFSDNMLYIRKYEKEYNEDEDSLSELDYLYSAEIRSVSENVTKPTRTLAVKLKAPDSKYTNKNILVFIPNVRQPVPLFIVFRALGIVSDKDIIEMCLLDLDKYESFMDHFVPSVHDAGGIMTQKLAIQYISTFTKGKRIEHVLEILSDYFLPHIGETNYKEKAYYLGYMVFRMLSVQNGLEAPTDRDNFKYKRLETVGTMLRDLFREYFTLQQDHIRVSYDTRLTLNQNIYSNNLQKLINTFQNEIFRKKVVDEGIRTAFKGNWGAKSNTKRIGVVQDLNRLSFLGYISHLRKSNLPLPAGVKLVGPRVLHTSQWGFIDPIDTPDGGNIGLHKSMAITARISKGSTSRKPLIEWLREKVSMKYIEECSPKILSSMTKVVVNGYWAGSIFDPIECVDKIKLYRRNALLSIEVSVTFEIKLNTIFIYNDSGRLCRPIFYLEKDGFKFNKQMLESIQQSTWEDLITGFNGKKVDTFHWKHTEIFELNELYENVEKETNPYKLERFLTKKGIIDYIDSSESENALIALNQKTMDKNKQQNFTHLEIDESLIFGVLTNLVNFPENSPPSRNLFSCGQSKQACSIYTTNHRMRMDKTAVVLNYGQNPLVKTRYLQYITNEEMPYGENAIVAIMCYGGYNMEDSILINEGALKRGLFNTTYYSTYELHEEKNESAEGISENVFTNIENANVIGKKEGVDYSQLDSYGLVREGTELNDKTAIIGMASRATGETPRDMSKMPKKGQLGVVDKSFMTEGSESERIAKVRVREVRIPNLGDKMASRSGQKGTIGLVIPEQDMPFTRDGVRPDLIVNPHAIPSRMTIGQLVECLMGKACCEMGGYGDCTAFVNKGSKMGVFGKILTNFGYHSSGNDILYNGMTGEQLESEIFIGPTYYMRLKHMVKDKVNYRARGPTTAMTRQPVSGRANDGGLRIGEMERDSVISHGISNFLKDSMMTRADHYKMAVCNKSGMLAIYNESKNLFLSPTVDGPIRFTGSIDDGLRIDNVSKHGRDFSLIEVPYSMKLLMQELMTINVQMRVITEDNIDHIESMNFSKNIYNLSQIDNMDALKKLFKNKREEGEPKMEKIKMELDNETEESEVKEAKDESKESTPFVPVSESYESVEKEYIMGEEVFYKNDDPNNQSLWNIIKISPNFITIQRKKNDGEEVDPNKDIKVVRKDEILHPGSVDLKSSPPYADDVMSGGGARNPANPVNPFNPMDNNGVKVEVNPLFVLGNNNVVKEGAVAPIEMPVSSENILSESIAALDTPNIVFKKQNESTPQIKSDESQGNQESQGKQGEPSFMDMVQGKFKIVKH